MENESNTVYTGSRPQNKHYTAAKQHNSHDTITAVTKKQTNKQNKQPTKPKITTHAHAHTHEGTLT